MNREQKRLQLQQKIAESEKTIAECELKIMDIEDEELFEEYSKEFEKETPLKSSKHSTQKKGHIWEMKNFSKYAIPRKYDEETETWKTYDNTQGRTLYLPFESLITTIINYQKGVPIKVTFEQVKSHLRTANGVKTWVYMYRAGAFNDEIKRLAPDYGYNADALISKECEGFESTLDPTQGQLI